MTKGIRHFAGSIINWVRSFAHFHLGWGKERQVYEALSRIPIDYATLPLARRLLLDGHFMNPGYWYRLQLLRAAVGADQGDELAFVWRHNTAECTRILQTLGVRKIITYFPRTDQKLCSEARRLASSLRSGDDLLNLQFPYEVPASFLYDTTLKRQRAATINVSDPLIERDICEFLSSIDAAHRLIEGHYPDLIAMSHAITSQCTPLAWLGARQGIPVVTLFGNYGTPRFWRMNQPDDIFNGMDRPEKQDLDILPTSQADALAEIGKRYLDLRFSGKTNDLGGRMAFSGSTEPRILHSTGDSRPVVAVYASNWFDFPHALGMSRFRDFLDWIESTLQVAMLTPSVRWLFRAHPCDKWYGGITLSDKMPECLPEHIMLVPNDCPGSLVMDMADALITYHGTAAIEYAAQGKPVLVPDRGWYHDCGFVLYPDSRQHYLDLLSTDWFNRVDTRSASRRAEIFAGWYFCTPDWQAKGTLLDDSERALQQQRIINLIKDEGSSVGKEILSIRNWMKSGTPGYHTFKMKQADAYSLSNVIR